MGYGLALSRNLVGASQRADSRTGQANREHLRMCKSNPLAVIALGLWALCLFSCSHEEQLWSTDSGLRTVKVVKVRTEDLKLKQTHHELRVTDKPPVIFTPFSETSSVERREVPFIPVGEPTAMEQRNVVYLPSASFTQEDAESIAYLLGNGSEVHGIHGFRLGQPDDYDLHFRQEGSPVVVVSIAGAAWCKQGGLETYLGELDERQNLVLKAYLPEFAQPRAARGEPPLPSLSELAQYADRQGKTLGQTFTLIDPNVAAASPTATPSPTSSAVR